MDNAIALQVDADHPALRGHFPGRPIVPGVLLLDWAIAAIATAEQRDLLPATLTMAKFHSPVGPNEQVELRYRIEASGAIHFAITGTDRKIASASLLPTGAQR
jgi:3-hydroxyacyl-[acyl-carrier-protein] dehydratase